MFGARLDLLCVIPLGNQATHLLALSLFYHSVVIIMKKAIILLSGGLDSATCLAIARAKDFDCYALSFDYGQRHANELDAAKAIASTMGVSEHRVVSLSIDQWGGSALTCDSLDVPDYSKEGEDIPITYVPARNTVFLSIALGWAEVLDCNDIFIGVSAIDYSGYPDCRPEFIQAFEGLAQKATKAGAEGKHFQIHAPLIHLSKADTILEGTRLGLDYAMTVSCYRLNPEGQACGRCESCVLRRQGFHDAGMDDPTRYV